MSVSQVTSTSCVVHGTSVDLNKVLRAIRKQMRDEGTGVLQAIYEATDRFGLTSNQVLAVSAALDQEGWS